MHGGVRPVIFSSCELVPLALEFLLPSFVLGDEPPKRGHRQHHPIDELWVPERRNSLYLVKESTKLVDESFLFSDFSALRCRWIATGVFNDIGELSLLVGQLGSHQVVLNLEEAVASKAMSIEPDAVAAGWHSELPQDRGFAAALGIALEVMLEEA